MLCTEIKQAATEAFLQMEEFCAVTSFRKSMPTQRPIRIVRHQKMFPEIVEETKLQNGISLVVKCSTIELIFWANRTLQTLPDWDVPRIMAVVGLKAFEKERRVSVKRRSGNTPPGG